MPRSLDQRGYGAGGNEFVSPDARRGDAEVTPCKYSDTTSPTFPFSLLRGSDDRLPPESQGPGRGGWDITWAQVMLLA
jgi:hypothetical protein